MIIFTMFLIARKKQNESSLMIGLHRLPPIVQRAHNGWGTVDCVHT